MKPINPLQTSAIRFVLSSVIIPITWGWAWATIATGELAHIDDGVGFFILSLLSPLFLCFLLLPIVFGVGLARYCKKVSHRTFLVIVVSAMAIVGFRVVLQRMIF